MKKEVIYLDNTSVPSAYYDDRVVWRMEYTQQWWHEKLMNYQVFISPMVIAEILETQHEQIREKLLSLILDFPQFKLSSEIELIAQGYVDQKIIPTKYAADAFHIAIASYYKADFLVTWNCKHLAEGHRRKSVRLFNISEGLYVPSLKLFNE